MKITLFTKREYPEILQIKKEFKVGPGGDICMAIGGDGTFIRAAREFDGPILPIRSLDKGSIGYYSDISLSEIGYAIEKIKSGDYSIEKLGNKIELEYKKRKYYVVNEAVMTNEKEEVSFKIYETGKNGRKEIYPFVMSGDGILITSVVGSTAYNKSAGGPIIMESDVFCMTPINIDGPYRNPIIAGSSRQVEIEVVKYNGRLRYDGIEVALLKPGDSFKARLSEKELNIIRFRKYREEFGAKLERIIRSRMEKQ